MKIYRVVEFNEHFGEILPVSGTFYRTRSQARAMRTRYLSQNGWEDAGKVFIQTADVEWVKL